MSISKGELKKGDLGIEFKYNSQVLSLYVAEEDLPFFSINEVKNMFQSAKKLLSVPLNTD